MKFTSIAPYVFAIGFATLAGSAAGSEPSASVTKSSVEPAGVQQAPATNDAGVIQIDAASLDLISSRAVSLERQMTKAALREKQVLATAPDTGALREQMQVRLLNAKTEEEHRAILAETQAIIEVAYATRQGGAK